MTANNESGAAMDRTEERIIERIGAEIRGMTPEETQALILHEVRKVNGTVQSHERILKGDPANPVDRGVLPDIEKNTTFRETWQTGGRLARYLVPVVGGGLAANLVVGVINLIQSGGTP